MTLSPSDWDLLHREVDGEITDSDSFQGTLQESLAGGTSTDEILARVSQIVTKRLDELTPEMVKEIVQHMIRRHLGWLVIWGGVFGALIGLLAWFVAR